MAVTTRTPRRPSPPSEVSVGRLNLTHIRKYLFALVGAVLLSMYVGRVVRVYRAEHSADASQGESRVSGLERSIRLAPDDAEFPHLLGLRLSASDHSALGHSALDHSAADDSASDQNKDGSRAIADLRRAVALNPNRGGYWLDLASLYQVANKVDQEDEALESALRAEPGNPQLAADAGQFFLASGQIDRAFPLFRRALEKNPEAADAILRACWQRTADPNLIFARVIPADPQVQFDFLGMLTSQSEAAAAGAVWQSIISAGKRFSPELSFFYFEYLLKERDVAQFQRAWFDLGGLAPEIRSYLPNENLMVNSGFEHPVLNAGLDWRHQAVDHIAAGIDDKVAHSGTRSLSITYDGNPGSDAGWMQYIPVESGADYEFSVWIKSADVTSSSGPRVAIVDAFSGDKLLITDDVLDTHPWRQLKGALHVPPETKLVAIKIVRVPANTRIRGRFWVDDLRLVKK